MRLENKDMRCQKCKYFNNCKCYSCERFKECEYADACIHDFIHVNPDKTQLCKDYKYDKEVEKYFKGE